ncbi:hypothetical protein OKA_05814 [Enterococcus faecium EnGen0026]|uniref:Uncharacterized protein n=1 Tax=Enterococcus faecium EnGen0026 TaxID=1138917 RepID=A0A829A091_ENTFC|nr:hypothetical protein OKA_05814 [Enterococcus faecium EnGen0026]
MIKKKMSYSVCKTVQGLLDLLLDLFLDLLYIVFFK